MRVRLGLAMIPQNGHDIYKVWFYRGFFRVGVRLRFFSRNRLTVLFCPLTFRSGNVDPPKIRIVKRTIMRVEVTKTDLCSAPNWSCVLSENATAPRKPKRQWYYEIWAETLKYSNIRKFILWFLNIQTSWLKKKLGYAPRIFNLLVCILNY